MQSSLSWSFYLVDLKMGLCCRPVDAKIRKTVKLPKVKGVWRVEDRFGDWDVVQSRFFGAGVRLVAHWLCACSFRPCSARILSSYRSCESAGQLDHHPQNLCMGSSTPFGAGTCTVG